MLGQMQLSSENNDKQEINISNKQKKNTKTTHI